MDCILIHVLMILMIYKVDSSLFNISSDIESLTVKEDATERVFFNISTDVPYSNTHEIRANIFDEKYAIIQEPNNYLLSCDQTGASSCSWSVNFTVYGIRYGKTKLAANISPSLENDLKNLTYKELPVYVLREETIAEKAFTLATAVGICINNFGFGCAFLFKDAREYFRKPKEILMGSLLIFTMQPLLAWFYIWLMKLPALYALGLLTLGSGPGGGFSNIASLISGGDVTLSLCMTLTNNVVAFGMMPLWILTLGQHLVDSEEDKVELSFLTIFLTLLMLTIPMGIGMLMQKCAKKVAAFLRRILKVMTLGVTCTQLALGIYTKWYVVEISLSEWQIPISAISLMFSGIILNLLIASFLLRLELAKVKTFACEVALQNFGLSFTVLMSALKPPDNDTAALIPLNVGLYQPMLLIPFGLVKLCICLYKKHTGDFEIENGPTPSPSVLALTDHDCVNKSFQMSERSDSYQHSKSLTH